MPDQSCCVCQNALKEDLKFNQFLGTEGTDHRCRICIHCGLIQRSLLPAPDEPTEGLLYGEYTAGDNSANRRSLMRLDLIRQLLPENGLMLDVGAGSGAFVKEARHQGLSAYGIEMLPQDGVCEWLVNHDISKAPFLIDGRTFEVINLNHVLEHVSDPIPFLKGILASLSDSGTLIVEVPNEVRALSIRIKQVLGKKSNSKTAFLDHRLFFERRSLINCLEKVGFQVIKASTPRVCYRNGFIHESFDQFQSLIGQGNVLEILARKHNL